MSQARREGYFSNNKINIIKGEKELGGQVPFIKT
jgi:hypothetical protein